jgi:hypothetical protein
MPRCLWLGVVSGVGIWGFSREKAAFEVLECLEASGGSTELLVASVAMVFGGGWDVFDEIAN